jgi:hypothetical protein
MDDLPAQIQRAVSHFWSTRGSQAASQDEGRDLGGRSAVTGGRQMDGFVNLVTDLLHEAGVPKGCVHFEKKRELPGWFRAEKKWDLVVIHKSELLAAVEFKSQIGPSFGNNFNNRTEEALGSATDLWAAYREGAFKPSSRPWLGYLMLLEDCERSQTGVKCKSPHFRPFPEFDGASYRRRYEILIEKLLRERLYDGACFLTSRASDGPRGGYDEPQAELKFQRLVTPLIGHVTAFCKQT